VSSNTAQQTGGAARRLWGPKDVAEYLGIPVQTLYQWRTRNYGPPARRAGKHLRYSPDDVVAWFESLPTEAA
jgi:predicted DNA-binding transcriptional regulator AlpA